MNTMKSIFITAIFSLVVITSFAQKGEKDFEKKMEMMNLMFEKKMGYLNDHLELKEQERIKFNEAYQEFHEVNLDFMQKNKPARKEELEKMTEGELFKEIDRHIMVKEEKLELEKNFIQQLVDIIGPKKYFELQKVEHDFKREMKDKHPAEHMEH